MTALAKSDEVGQVFVPKVSGLQKASGSRPSSTPHEDEDAGDTDPEEEEGVPQPSPPSSEKKKWFDAATQQSRAVRQFSGQLSKHKAKMAAQLEAMKEATVAARAVSGQVQGDDARGILTEMMILQARQEALQAVLSGTAETFRAYVTKLKESGQSGEAVETRTSNTRGSANELLLANLGFFLVKVSCA